MVKSYLDMKLNSVGVLNRSGEEPVPILVEFLSTASGVQTGANASKLMFFMEYSIQIFKNIIHRLDSDTFKIPASAHREKRKEIKKKESLRTQK